MDLINANQQALKTNSFFIKLLFCGTPERQKIAAEKMAQELNIPFHYFDGREDNHKKLHSLLKRIDLSTGKEFVFVSSADKIDRSQLETILGHTGSVSKKLLLCIGASSQNQLDPALISRYGFIIQA
ncbi:MAG TPA: hypothetical protein VLE96_02850 [Chlamydiales bacterium]|nr:hypothetical protein [Chlamydiales bacterium]